MDDTFNYVLEADFSKNDADKKIPAIIQHFAKSNIPFSWWISPYDKPDDLGERLHNAGLVNAENNIGMYRDLDLLDVSSTPIRLDIQQVRDAKGLQDFASVLFTDKKSFSQYYKWIADILTDDDPVEFFVGYVDGKPVTRGQLVYFAQVVGIHGVSTAVDERRKGYGTAIVNFLLQHAKEKQFHIAVLQASQEGLLLYQRQGFKECCVFKEFKNLG
jgi:GNAT superfamily N-acetyltransferase